MASSSDAAPSTPHEASSSEEGQPPQNRPKMMYEEIHRWADQKAKRGGDWTIDDAGDQWVAKFKRKYSDDKSFKSLLELDENGKNRMVTIAQMEKDVEPRIGGVARQIIEKAKEVYKEGAGGSEFPEMPPAVPAKPQLNDPALLKGSLEGICINNSGFPDDLAVIDDLMQTYKTWTSLLTLEDAQELRNFFDDVDKKAPESPYAALPRAKALRGCTDEQLKLALLKVYHYLPYLGGDIWKTDFVSSKERWTAVLQKIFAAGYRTWDLIAGCSAADLEQTCGFNQGEAKMLLSVFDLIKQNGGCADLVGEHNVDWTQWRLPQAGSLHEPADLLHRPQRFFEKGKHRIVITQDLVKLATDPVKYLQNADADKGIHFYRILDGPNGMGKSVIAYMIVCHLVAQGFLAIYIPNSDEWCQAGGESGWCGEFFKAVAYSLKDFLDKPTQADPKVTWRELVDGGLADPCIARVQTFFRHYHQEPGRAFVVDRQNEPYRWRTSNPPLHNMHNFPHELWNLLNFSLSPETRGLVHIIIGSSNNAFTQYVAEQKGIQHLGTYVAPLTKVEVGLLLGEVLREDCGQARLEEAFKETRGVPEQVYNLGLSYKEGGGINQFYVWADQYFRNKYQRYCENHLKNNELKRANHYRALLLFHLASPLKETFDTLTMEMDCGFVHRGNDGRLGKLLTPRAEEFMLDWAMLNLPRDIQDSDLTFLSDINHLQNLPDNPKGSEHGWRFQRCCDGVLRRLGRRVYTLTTSSGDEPLDLAVARARAVQSIPTKVERGWFYMLRPDFPYVDAFIVAESGIMYFFQYSCAQSPWQDPNHNPDAVFRDVAEFGGRSVATAVWQAAGGTGDVEPELSHGRTRNARRQAARVQAREVVLADGVLQHVLVSPFSRIPPKTAEYSAVLGCQGLRGHMHHSILEAFHRIETSD